MTKDGTSLGLDPVHIVTSLFALLPIPVAVIDQCGNVVLSNSSFSEAFPGIQNLQSIPQHQLEVPGYGIYDIETVPLNDRGFQIAYAVDITKDVQLRRQVVHMEKMAAIGRLVCGVAQELNNPLAGILGYAQLAAGLDLDPAMRRMMEVVLTQAERAGKIVQNVLSLAAKAEPKWEAFNLNEVAQNVVQSREYEASVENIFVQLDLCDDMPCTTGDSSQIEQVLLNLILNAEHAIADVWDGQRRQGRITIRTTHENGRIQLSVTDNGSGIQASDMSRIFDPFFTTKGKKEGAGLGLSICADIVNGHGGDLYAWSTYGSGSTFTLELPVRRDNGELKKQKPARIRAGTSMRGKSILVIDDESHMTELISSVLVRHGAEVHAADSGRSALALLNKRSYDVVVCDQGMAGLSGQRLYRVAASLYPELQRRFLFVTGAVVNAGTHRCFTQAGMQFLRKPFRLQDLTDAIEGVLNRNQPQDS